MASNLVPGSEIFSKTSMKPSDSDEAAAQWASKVAANTGYVAGQKRVIISGNICACGSVNTSTKVLYDRKIGFIDTERTKGTLEIHVTGVAGLSKIDFFVVGTDAAIYTDDAPAVGSFFFGFDNLESYAPQNGTLWGQLSLTTNTAAFLNFGVSYSLYCEP